jgi:threonine dehydrogenase-like Zn-dependent dehydrogenase
MGLAVARDLTLSCSIASPNSFAQTLRLMATGRIQTEQLITHVLPLEEAGRAFEIQQTAPTERIKIHLEPPAEE